MGLMISLEAAAQTGELTEKLGRTVVYGDPAISPDGKFVAWTQTIVAESEPHVFLASVDGKPHAILLPTSGKRTDGDPAWSPDSKMLAFISTAGESEEQRQIWTASASGAGPKKLTHLKGYAARPRWSPDGKHIAFLYIEGAGGGGPLMAAAAPTGVIDTEIHNQRIAVLDLGGGAIRQVSPADLHVYDYDWSPDGASFVVTAAPGPGDNNWWIAQIYTIDAGTGRATAVYKPKLQLAVPRWSPDGRNIAFIEGLMSDEGFHGGDLFTMPASGGPVNRTHGRKASPSSLMWISPDRILFTESVGGGSALSELSVSGGAIREVWNAAQDIHANGNFPNFAVTRDGAAAVIVREGFTTPPEIWAGAIGKWNKLTNGNDAQMAAWGQAESLDWSNDGFRIQGWLLPPKIIETGRKYPMVVIIHGGPSSSVKPSWPSRSALAAILAGRGYFVLMANPRGSYGQGEDFTLANVKDFGHGDLRDIMAGVDTALARHPIDPQRLGVTGWSYGGYMTMWTVTQTGRFKAAMAGARIANWQSYYGQNLIDQWMVPFFGASVYDDPAVYERSSPIRFIKNVTTPTLVIVGEHDAECPAAQSYEFWHALRALGKTTQLVVYKGEGHLFVKPADRVDMQDRTIAWFDKYLQ